MEQKISIQHAVDRETIKVQTNTHCQNSLFRQDGTLKIVQIFFGNSCE